MGFIDQLKGVAGKFGDTVEKGAKSVSENSKKMAEKSRLKKEISQLESEINTAYVSIGKVFFERLAENPEPECQNAVDVIASKSARIEQLRSILSTLEDKITCQNCGASVNKTQKFCDKCGAKVAEAEEVVAEVKEDDVVVAEQPSEPETPVTAVNLSKEETEEETPSTETKICSECGKPADVSQIFCENCGKKF